MGKLVLVLMLAASLGFGMVGCKKEEPAQAPEVTLPDAPKVPDAPKIPDAPKPPEAE